MGAKSKSDSNSKKEKVKKQVDKDLGLNIRSTGISKALKSFVPRSKNLGGSIRYTIAKAVEEFQKPLYEGIAKNCGEHHQVTPGDVSRVLNDKSNSAYGRNTTKIGGYYYQEASAASAAAAEQDDEELPAAVDDE
jgi:hypothetical protein